MCDKENEGKSQHGAVVHTYAAGSWINLFFFLCCRNTFTVAGAVLQGSVFGLMAALSNRRLRISAFSCHTW